MRRHSFQVPRLSLQFVYLVPEARATHQTHDSCVPTVRPRSLPATVRTNLHSPRPTTVAAGNRGRAHFSVNLCISSQRDGTSNSPRAAQGIELRRPKSIQHTNARHVRRITKLEVCEKVKPRDGRIHTRLLAVNVFKCSRSARKGKNMRSKRVYQCDPRGPVERGTGELRLKCRGLSPCL